MLVIAEMFLLAFFARLVYRKPIILEALQSGASNFRYSSLQPSNQTDGQPQRQHDENDSVARTLQNSDEVASEYEHLNKKGSEQYRHYDSIGHQEENSGFQNNVVNSSQPRSGRIEGSLKDHSLITKL